MLNMLYSEITIKWPLSGADPGFQVRGRGGVALRITAASGARHKHFLGISCEKSRFSHKKIIFFPILGGSGAPPPGSTPAYEIIRLLQA